MTAHSARREAALRAAGIDPAIMAPEVLSAVELKPAPPPPSPANIHGLPYREPTRRLSDDEWNRIAHLLPDAAHASMTYRRWIDLMLEFVVAGKSWTQLGGRDSGTRERVRRERGKRKWLDVAAVALRSFDDADFADHVVRVCKWVHSGDVSVMALRRGIGPAARRWKIAGGAPTKPLS